MKRKVICFIVILVIGGVMGFILFKNYNSFKDKDILKNNNTLDNKDTFIDDNNKEKDNSLDNNKSNTSSIDNNGSKDNNSSKDDNKSNNGSKDNTNSKDNATTSGNISSKEEVEKTLSKIYPKLKVIDGQRVSIGTTKNGFSIYKVNDVYYIDDIMMVNKTYGLPESYIPVDTKESCIGKTSTCNKCINKTAYEAFNKMRADASSIGLNIYIASGYRPYVGQESIYNRYIKRDGKEAADTYSARPGYSEHQTSYSFDLNSITDSFIKTKEGLWVNDNAYLYGFIIRFPKGKDRITGYKYEPWHLRYVGYNLAKKLYNNGDWISLEEYFGVDSKYQD